MKIAIPVADNKLCNHFGHCERFVIFDIQDNIVENKQLLIPPPHEPGLLPRWLGELGVQVVIAGGMGGKALTLFAEKGVKVITGAPHLAPEELVEKYLQNALSTGPNVCDH